MDLSHKKLIGILFGAIVIINIPSALVDVIVMDDYALYSEAENNYIDPGRLARSKIGPFVQYFFAELMTITPILARLGLILCMAFNSVLFYYILVNILRTNKIVGVVSAILPQILPAQLLIPTFIIGSYPTWGMIPLLLTVISGKKYIDSKSIVLLISSLLLFYIALESLANPFVSFPILLIFLIVPFGRNIVNNLKERLYLVTGISTIALWRIYQIITKPAEVNVIQSHSIDKVVSRITSAFEWTNPLNIDGTVYSIGLIAATIFLFIFKFYSGRKENTIFLSIGNKQINTHLFRSHTLILFALAWQLGAFLPFAVSIFFSVRHVYVFGFGANVLLIFILFSLLKIIFKNNRINFIILCSLILCSGYLRIQALNKYYNKAEITHRLIQENVPFANLPENTQVIISGSTSSLLTAGYWLWSSGYLKFVSKRKDLVGIVSGPANPSFYNPLNKMERNYSYQMSGIDIDVPISMYNCSSQSCEKISYLLQWIKNDSEDSWNLFKTDSLNYKLYNIAKGTSLRSLNIYIFENNISPKDIYGYEENASNTDEESSIQYITKKMLDSKGDTVDILMSTMSGIDSTLENSDFVSNDNIRENSRFKTFSFQSENLIQNGTFMKDLYGWSCWSPTKECIMTFEEGMMDDNCISFENTSDQGFALGIASKGFSDIYKNEKYLIKFSYQCSIPGEEVEIFLRNNGPTYSNLAEPVKFFTTTNRNEFEVILIAIDSSDKARIDFQIEQQDGKIILDNIELRRIEEFQFTE